MASESNRWTCYICHETVPEGSAKSLSTQEISGNTQVYIDWDYRYEIMYNDDFYFLNFLIFNTSPNYQIHIRIIIYKQINIF